MTDMGRLLKEQMESFSVQIQQVMAVNVQQQETLRQVVATRLQQIQEDNTKRLEQMRATVDEKLQGTLEAKLGEEAKRLEEEKKVLSEKIGAYDNYKDNVRKQAQYFTSMPPKAAVDRLAKLDELLAIDILRQIDRTAEEQGKASIVPYFLSLMDPEKAASIQRKMTKMGGQEG